ncbi:MAG: hypothetical protein CK425_05755 [Parachlamydia sp.]|nr:MAG: hypothetical protein CK425_05755 [Parachlamydia sp.]
MELNFGQIFENLNFCKDSTRILIETKKLKSKDDNFFTVEASPTSFWTFGSQKKKVQAKNRTTVDFFTQLVQRHASPDIAPALTNELDKLKTSGNKLTAGKIRSIYQTVIASHLTGVRKTACLAAKTSDRIVFNKTNRTSHVQNVFFQSLRSKKKLENKQSIAYFYQAFVAEWGKERVDRTLQKYDINLLKMHRQGKPLTAKIVNKVTLGVSDYYAGDLHLAWARMQGICKNEIDVTSIPLREKQGLAASLGTKTDEELKAALRQALLNHFETPYDQLPSDIHTLVTKAALVDASELEFAFQGKRIEGVIVGYPPLGWKYFFYPKIIEDKERLQLYQTIFSLHKRVIPEAIEKAYNELLAKALVKKQMPVGMLIPAPAALAGNNFGASWYNIDSEIVTGRAKNAFHLVQIHKNGVIIPEILLYNSTRSIPVHKDAFTTLATDAYPGKPPGYLWKKAGVEEEKNILFKNLDTPINLVGHSLGGSHAQLALIMLIRQTIKKMALQGQHTPVDLPQRDFGLITFDSPALRRKDAEMVSKFLNDPANSAFAKRVSIQHYFSAEDAIPGAGGLHFGVNVAKEALNKINCSVLDALNLSSSHLKLHPHGRFYYLTRPEVDFKERETDIVTFNQLGWRTTIEIARKVSGLIIFPTVISLGFTKRFFFGWREHPSGMRLCFNKLIGKSYVHTVKKKNYGLPAGLYQAVATA